MFAENSQISGRQAFRLLSYDLLGTGTLLLPQLLAAQTGQDGIFSIALAVTAGLLFLAVLKELLKNMKGSYADYLKEQLPGWLAHGILALYVGWFLLVAGYTAYLFSELVVAELVEEIGVPFVLFSILLLCFYGMMGGIEGRARVYEILFWILLIPFGLMVVSAWKQMDMDYWCPVAESSFGAVGSGSLQIFFFESILFLVLFLQEFVKGGKNTVYKNAKRALFLFGILLAVLYLTLEGMFGSAMLSGMRFAAVTMMSSVQISGGFLKRTDAFMLGFWFFTLYALLSSMVFYAGNLIGRVRKTEKKLLYVIVLVPVYFLAFAFYRVEACRQLMENVIWKAGMMFVVLVPVLLFLKSRWMKQTQKKRRAGALALIFLSSMLLLEGCKSTELEDREFPVLLAVEDKEDFERAWLDYKQSGNKRKDYNHLKVVLIEQSFFEDEKKLDRMLDMLEGEHEVPWNAYVLVTDSCEALQKAGEELSIPLGEYLEQMLENTSPVEQGKLPTLGMLYKERKNHVETLFLPYVKVWDREPAVVAYEVWKRGTAAGMVDTDMALASYLIQNALEKETLLLSGNYYVQLDAPSCEISFEERTDGTGRNTKEVCVRVRGEGRLLDSMVGQDAMTEGEVLSDRLEAYLKETANRALDEGLDLTNSFKKLGGYKRGWYEVYKDAPASYERDIVIVFSAEILWKND